MKFRSEFLSSSSQRRGAERGGGAALQVEDFKKDGYAVAVHGGGAEMGKEPLVLLREDGEKIETISDFIGFFGLKSEGIQRLECTS